MIHHRISGLPVIDVSGTVVGMITEGDLLRRTETGTDPHVSGWRSLLIGPERLAEQYVRTHARKVEEVMTRDVVSIAPATPLAEVVALMQARRVKRLPVLEHGRLSGIVSRADLLRALQQLLPKVATAAISDADIRRRILAEVDQQRWAPRASIDIKVENGRVELRGLILHEGEREALRVLAENTPGVKSVTDQLVWVEPYTGMAVEFPPGNQTPPPSKR